MNTDLNLLVAGLCTFAGVWNFQASPLDALNIAFAVMNAAIYIRHLKA